MLQLHLDLWEKAKNPYRIFTGVKVNVYYKTFLSCKNCLELPMTSLWQNRMLSYSKEKFELDEWLYSLHYQFLQM